MRRAENPVEQIARATGRDRRLIEARRGHPVSDGGDQLQALFDLVAALEGQRIAYALIGGIAVGVHSAQPRATQDVDIAVSTLVRREKIIDVLTDASFVLTGEFPHSLNFHHPSGEPVQVAIDQPFDDMIERAETVLVGDVQVRIVTRDDLIASKERAANDPTRRKSKSLRDRADIELLRGDVGDQDEGW